MTAAHSMTAPTLRLLGTASLPLALSARAASASNVQKFVYRRYHVSTVWNDDKGKSSSSSLKGSKAAFNQRQILDELRASTSSSTSSSLSEAQPRPRFNATAEAALDAASGSRGGGIPLGVAGLSAGGGLSSQPTLIDRATGQGKPWSQLKTGQKVARATVQSSRATLIFGGGALTFVLIYALTSELFAKNSPTVIYADACKRVQKSAEIGNHLLMPYRFRTSPTVESGSSDFSPLNPPSVKDRRRSRSVPSVSFTDERTGEEKMLLRFWIGAREKGEEWSIWDTARYEIVEAGKWTGRKIMEGGEWLGEQLGVDLGSHYDADGDKEAGSIASTSSSGAEANAPSDNVLSRTWSSALGGIGSVVRSSTEAITSTLTSPTAPKSRRSSEPGTWSTGEVHAELVKDQDGTLQYRTLFVDVPNSQAFMRQRVWIVRKPGDVQR
ncbi:Mitochondrial import inner membrane translocase subunit Tim21 [Kalmanozyma brasiliensis GHG001]|uniref:Mitochondrial import inner membrane translocase subunit TIM21 n=1 Tax=Kalmanozyma brasiliensis (strain GHG001) TaxID=1365824 RepID=V5ER55_KALBG|nr:Mitochondrial import inner membrane translocase subunit Tim21 [Kalmanozyma brasiliensis GHG001]EST07595.1 Mitochondrial import inner membrane translocase subunit Tim21 [Kalmanozyma brasiliensis GHG001]